MAALQHRVPRPRPLLRRAATSARSGTADADTRGRRPGEHGGRPARGHPRLVRRLRPRPGPERDQPPGRPAQVDRAPAGQPAVRGGLAGAEQRRLPGRPQAARARQRRPAADRPARGRVQAPALARPAHRPRRAPRHPRPRRGGVPRPGDHHPGLAAHPGGRPSSPPTAPRSARSCWRSRTRPARRRRWRACGGAPSSPSSSRGRSRPRWTAPGRPASPTTAKRPTRAWAASRPPSAAVTG